MFIYSLPPAGSLLLLGFISLDVPEEDREGEDYRGS